MTGPRFAHPPAIFPIAHPFAYTVIWAVAIVLVCAPLSVVLYQRSIKS